MAITIGSKAPDFSLVSDNKEMVNLSDYKGRNVVVLFFPLSFTGVCTKELCTMRDNIANYSNMNAEIVAISVDSLFVLEQYKKAQNLNFPLLSDFNKTASRAYDSLYDEFPAFGMQGVSKRSAFVVDKEGIVKYQEICASPGDLPNFEAIKVTLSEIN